MFSKFASLNQRITDCVARPPVKAYGALCDAFQRLRATCLSRPNYANFSSVLGIYGREKNEAGERPDAPCAPGHPQLPAVRAVSGLWAGRSFGRKNSGETLSFEKMPLLQGICSGSKENTPRISKTALPESKIKVSNSN